jgi:hypothetical protein
LSSIIPDMGDGEEEDNATIRVARLRDIALGIASVLGVIFLFKLYAMSGYSLTTMNGVVASVPPRAMVGMVVSYMYFLMPMSTFAIIWCCTYHRRELRGLVWACLICIALASALVSNWILLLECAGIYAVSAAIEGRMRQIATSNIQGEISASRAKKMYWSDRARGKVFAVLGGAYLLWVIAYHIQAPWTDAEVFVFNTDVVVEVKQKTVSGTRGKKVQVADLRTRRAAIGYLISDQDGWITILNARTRFVMHIPAGVITQRNICHEKAQLISRKPVYYGFWSDINSPNKDCESILDLVSQGQ